MFAASCESAMPKMPHSSWKPPRISIASDVNASGKRFMPRLPESGPPGPSGHPVCDNADLLRGIPPVRLDLHRERNLDRVRTGRKDPSSRVNADLLPRPVQEPHRDIDSMGLAVGVLPGEDPFRDDRIGARLGLRPNSDGVDRGD